MYRWRSMNGAGREMGLRRLAIELGIMVAAALIFALLGPFETYPFPFGERLARWLMFALGGYLCFRPVIAGGRALAAQAGLPPWLLIALACAIAALPTTLLVGWTLMGVRFGEMRLGGLFGLYLNVLLAGGIVTAVQVALYERKERALARREEPGEDALPPSVSEPAQPAGDGAAHLLFDQLPPALGRDILYVGNEDHYVRVHTAQGNALVLMRMRDVAAALEASDGLRVHRGWWVARAAVAQTVRRDRATLLRLVDGREVPVARNALPVLRAAGWL